MTRNKDGWLPILLNNGRININDNTGNCAKSTFDNVFRNRLEFENAITCLSNQIRLIDLEWLWMADVVRSRAFNLY